MSTFEPSRPRLQRLALTVSGQVQGVGFRPFVYRIAHEHKLTGSVRNTPQGVRIEVQGLSKELSGFVHDLEHEQPPLAHIVSLREEPLALVQDEKDFAILHSSAGQGHNVLISPDTATCLDCMREVADPDNRRYLYPFTNCTNCGPRYTITRTIPYDRAGTSMACFPMCPECAAEYADPLDRRFHAQPNACPVCGPQVWLTDAQGREELRGQPAIQAAAEALLRGRIAAVKGLGGFHLACLAWGATGELAVAELRERKHRPHKPLALMVPDVETARRMAHVDNDAALVMEGVQRPILLCPILRQPYAGDTPGLPANVAPDTDQIGLMLPYTPLHFVLFHYLRQAIDNLPSGAERPLPALVMTSGNMSHEPICLGNREALARLRGIADLFLLHNRDILIRTDDSVVRPLPFFSGRSPALQFFRRARGYTPNPVFLRPIHGGGPSVMGLGPELKNTLCLTKGDQAFVSQHIGDLENLETFGFFREIAEHLQGILQTRPQALIRDLHPDYLSSRFAQEQDALPVLALQHHFAHVHAVLAEHKHHGPALGLALDGTGLGDDGTLWGGECLFVDTRTLEQYRVGHFAQMRLPGGESAIKEPWRLARSCLWLLGRNTPKSRQWPWLPQWERLSEMLPQILEKGVNAPITSSCGRLFDAVAAMIGLQQAISYEGQAAIVLEHAQATTTPGLQGYDCPLMPFEAGRGHLILDTMSLFAQVVRDWEAGENPGVISRRFHVGLIRGLACWAAEAARITGVRHVALSGGVMQNRTLRLELPAALEAKGLLPMCHKELPPNDGCISLGQAAWGRLAVDLGATAKWSSGDNPPSGQMPCL